MTDDPRAVPAWRRPAQPQVLQIEPPEDEIILPTDAGGEPPTPFVGRQPWDWPGYRRGEKW